MLSKLKEAWLVICGDKLPNELVVYTTHSNQGDPMPNLWTSTRPQLPGWYWLKNADYPSGTIVALDDNGAASCLGSERVHPALDGEWTGPLTVPGAMPAKDAPGFMKA